MSKAHNCARCPARASYDKNPKSFKARLWRWHINWCPGWKAYYRSLSPEEQQKLTEIYHFKQH